MSHTEPSHPRIALQRTLALVWLACTSACSALPETVKVDHVSEQGPFKPAIPHPVVTAPVTGSLFNAQRYQPPFEERRARHAGDTLTIQIVENISASQRSSSSVDRSSKVDGSIASVPFINKSVTDRAALSAGSSNAFAGKGGTESANTFSGSITATVIDILPNGHLLVGGEKQIGVNQNVDILRFSGTVDPRLIQPGNQVLSTQVANARIESRNRGQQGEVQSIGWLSRFFLNVYPF